VNLYVQLGRGQDYSWSATSAGQDITDTFALALCEPDGGAATLASQSYRFRGACIPIERLETTNSWAPTLADSTARGSETLRAQRTKLGLVGSSAMERSGAQAAYASRSAPHPRGAAASPEGVAHNRRIRHVLNQTPAPWRPVRRGVAHNKPLHHVLNHTPWTRRPARRPARWGMAHNRPLRHVLNHTPCGRR